MNTRLFLDLLLACTLVVVLCLSGCSSKGTDDVVEDDGRAPSTVTDLAVVSFTDNSVTLTWTASGDDSTSGTATAYDLRISNASIHYGNFDSATQVSGLPKPKPAGESEQFAVTGLQPDSTYYFALRVTDENDNYEGVSNCVHATCFTDHAVSIPDAGLLAAIRTQLGIPTGDIMESDLFEMTTLQAYDRSITDLTGLEYCIKVTVLDITNNSISDLSPISALEQLGLLHAGSNLIVNIAPISGLAALTQADFTSNQISDLTPVTSLTGLTILDVESNLVVDVSPVSGLTNLQTLDLGFNSVKDITPIVNNTGIGSGDNVSLVANPLNHESIMTHISALRDRGVNVIWTDNTHPPFQVFDLRVDSVTATSVTLSWTAPGEDFNEGTAWRYEIRYSTNQGEIQAWSGGQTVANVPAPDTAGTRQTATATGLSEDSVYYFAIKTQDNSENWSDVSNIVWAQPYSDAILTFNDAALESAIRGALAMPTGDIYKSDLLALDTLIADNQGISDLTGLEYCTNLTYLHLIDNSISQIDELVGLAGLRDLNLQGNNIADISPLSSLGNLSILQLTGNPVSDLSDLASLDELIYLSISSIATADLQPLASLTTLEYLYAVNDNISDLLPLENCPHLKHLYLDANAIVDISMLSDMLELSNLSLRYNSIEDISPLVENSGLASGDQIALDTNPLSSESIITYIPALRARGVTVTY